MVIHNHFVHMYHWVCRGMGQKTQSTPDMMWQLHTAVCRLHLGSIGRHCLEGTAWHKCRHRRLQTAYSLTVLSSANCTQPIGATLTTVASTCVLRSAQGQQKDLQRQSSFTILCKGKQSVDRWSAQIHTTAVSRKAESKIWISCVGIQIPVPNSHRGNFPLLPVIT